MPLKRIYKLYISKERHYIHSLNNMLGFVPANTSLYRLAFRHKSATMTQGDPRTNNATRREISVSQTEGNVLPNSIRSSKSKLYSNERLEFLGDAILGAVIADYLFKKFPYKDEGFLTEMRAKMVNRSFLNELARKIGIEEMIDYKLGSSDLTSWPNSLYGDAFEALIGAVYLDKGFSIAQQFILHRVVKNHVDIDKLEKTEANYKSKLIEWGQRQGKQVLFKHMERKSTERNKLFCVKVIVSNEEVSLGQDFTKKNAEKRAAEKACQILRIE